MAISSKGVLSSIAATALVACSVTGIAGAQTPAAPPAPESEQVEEIVVTARRSGIPVWRIKGPRTSVILVGAIEEVSKATRWDPASLTAALRMADRVMFPQSLDMKLSPFAIVGLAFQFFKAEKLPEGQSLAAMMPRDQFERLVALRNKGVLKPGFERRNPLFVAIDLHDFAEGKAGTGMDAHRYVRRAVKKYKIRQVPIPKVNAKQPVKAVLKAPPQAHLGCLTASIAMAEAGPGAVQARSEAWADRRVKEVLSSPVQKAITACELDEYLVTRPDWRRTLRQILADPQVTVAVLDLASVAQPGGVLDQLATAGYDIKGPAWK